MVDTYGSADGVAIGGGAYQADPQAPVACPLIVAEENRGATVGRHQHVHIAVAVEIAQREAAADASLGEPAPNVLCCVAERAGALVEEEMRRLRVSDVAADVPHGLVDVPIGHDEVERAVEVQIGEHAPESVPVAG